jgi:PERQ amino acid-rich with GYF domain-containing protein
MSLPEGVSSWVIATDGPVEDAWKEADGPNSTADTIPTSNATQEVIISSPSEQISNGVLSAGVAEETKFERPSTESSMAVPASSVSAAPTSGKSRKAQKRAATPTTAASTAASVPQPEQSSSQPAVPKPAWQVEEDAKKAASISLREIQEAEAKKAEARRAAERERERAARMAAAATGDPKEEAQTFTASWGLPTSQAGSRVVVNSTKEVASSPTPANTTPVWSGAPKVAVAKKSMKEILEEEEKRKKMAATREVTAAAAVAAATPKRLYADTNAKVSGCC